MSRYWYFAFLAILLTGCASASANPANNPQNTSADAPGRQAPPESADLEDLGPAPELENDIWLNVDAPLRLADLRGKVVLLDMWTFF